MSTATRSRWQTLPTLAVLGAGLLVVAFVWVLSCVWSFSEQTRAAGQLGFQHPAVLPYMLDALAGALALVALAAALAGQSAGLARFGVTLALAGSVWANAVGVSLRLPAHDHALRDAIAMAAVAPLAEIVTLEVLLGRLRRLVLWLRGEEPPAAIPHLRLIRLVLNPKTFADWRKTVLDLTQTTPASSSSNRPVEDTLRDADAAGPGGGTHLTPGPARDTGGVGAPTDPSGLTTPGGASESAAVVHLPARPDRIPTASGSASEGASRSASGRGASAARTASRPARVTASADAVPHPDARLLDAVRDAVEHTGQYPSGRSLARDARVHQNVARAAIATVRAERESRQVSP